MQEVILDSTWRSLISMIISNGLGYGGLLTAIAGLSWMSGNKFQAKQKIMDIYIGYGITCSSYVGMSILAKIGESIGK